MDFVRLVFPLGNALYYTMRKLIDSVTVSLYLAFLVMFS